MAAKIVSQKKFSKLVASTGSLSQPPGALPRMSNLLFTQRGSLQIANGSFALPTPTPEGPVPAPSYTLSISSFTKNNPTLGLGQFPPVMTLIEQLIVPTQVGAFLTAITTAGPGPNPAGYYLFAVVTMDMSGGTTSVGWTGGFPRKAWKVVYSSVDFNTVTITWVNEPGNNGYQVWYLGFSPSASPPAPFAGQYGNLLGTVAVDVTTFTSTAGLLPGPNVQAPWLNTTQYVTLADIYYYAFISSYLLACPGGGVGLSPANYNIFPAAAPQPVSLQIGDPQFSLASTTPGYSPYGGIPGQVCPIPTQVQFAGQVVVILGNGLPPVAYDPSTGVPPSAPAPLANTFQDAFPDWQASVTWLTGSQVTDGAGNYYTATQGGVSGATVPTPWNTALGAQTADGTVLWTSQGPIVASTAPRGAAHAVAYAGSLWLANTSPADTSDGIDGPSCLKMSDSNNPNSWNPVNTAFVGRQDGSQITGLCPFTIAALGISPTGSLCIFKEFTTYQFIGVFGTTSFEIQPAQTNLGCIAARSIQFLPGFGVVRFTHLGFAVFDGINDRLISEDIRPYLFGGVDSEADLTPVDPTYCYLSQSAQTVAPPMYLCATPLLGAAGALARLFCYDLVMKSWAVLDLPWAITSMATVAGGEGYPLVLAGKTDGTIQRLQAGDLNWDQGDTAQSAVQWSFRTPELFGEGGTQRLFYEKATITGYGSPAMVQSIIANLWLDGQRIGAQGIDVVPMGGSNLFTASVSIFRNGNRAHLDISGNSGGATGVIDSVDWAVTAKSSMARRIIS
jgi:hypothetical protein